VKSYYDKLHGSCWRKLSWHERQEIEFPSKNSLLTPGDQLEQESAAMAAQNAARSNREEKIQSIDPLALREKWKEGAMEQAVDLDLLLRNALERSRGPEKGLRPSGTTTDPKQYWTSCLST